MKIFAIFAVFGFINVVSSDVYCCKGEESIVDEEKRVCYNAVENTTTSLHINCIDDFMMILGTGFNITIQSDMFVVDGTPQKKHGEFCIDSSTLTSNDTLYLVCPNAPEETKDIPLGYCIVVSVIFLVLTVVVYCLLPEVRDLLGKSITNFCTSLAIALSLQSIVKITTLENRELCDARGVLAYFFILASFFWTNAISIQILLSIRKPFVPNYGWKPFIWYAMYAWGVPALLTICMAIVNYHPGDHQKPFGSCGFNDMTQVWYYMYSVTTILIVLNICMLGYILITVWRNSFQSSQLKSLKYKFWMTLKLFLIMGIPWIFEMISALSPDHVIWSIIDILNGLQGPLIFLALVVFRRRVIKALYKRGYLDCISGIVEKHLAVADDEEDVVEHTTAVPLH